MTKIKKILSIRAITNLLIIAILCIVFSIASPYFFTFSNFENIISQSAVTILAAFAMTLIILTGGIDLSIGAVVGLSSIVIVIAINSGIPISVACLLGIMVGLIFGSIHGIIVSKTNINPFLITLATMNIARGIAYIITNGSTIPFNNPTYAKIFSGSFLGIPVPLYIVLLCLGILSFILKKIKIGREIYAIGSNKIAAELSGINVTKVNMFTYCLAGILIGITSIIVVGRVSSGIPSYGNGLEIETIVAVVLGGASFTGGRGTVLGTIIGALVIVVLTNGLTMIGVGYYAQMLIKGAVILIAVYWDSIGSNK